MSFHHPTSNVRSTRYFVASTTVQCWHCARATEVVALGVPAGHELADFPGEEGHPADDPSAPAWEPSDLSAILFFVRDLKEPARRRLQQASGGFRLAYSAATFDSYWANHCAHCGELLDDHELHCEPNIAFVAADPARARAVRLARVDEGVEAAADGYAIEPQFFDLMTWT